MDQSHDRRKRNLNLLLIAHQHKVEMLSTLQKITPKKTCITRKNKKFILPKHFEMFGKFKFTSDFVNHYINPFFDSPSFSHLLTCLKDEVENFTQFCDNMEAFRPQLAEYYRSHCSLPGSNRNCPEDMLRWQKRSIIARLYYRLSLNPVTGSRIDTVASTISEFFRLLRKLPKFTQNLATEIVSKCELSSLEFVSTLQSQIDFKNSSDKTYDSALRQIAKHFGFPEAEIDDRLFLSNDISKIEIAEFLNDRLMSSYWKGGRVAQVIYALQKRGKLLNLPRFDTKYWSHFAKWSKKTFCSDASLGVMKLVLSLQFVILWYYALLEHNEVRVAEFIRLLCLTGQRAIDYIHLRSTDILEAIEHMDFHWLWGKTSTHANPIQHSYVPKQNASGRSKFFDIKSCVDKLFALQPQDDEYLLRFKNENGDDIHHPEVLTKALQFFPENVEILQPSVVKPYDFKKLLASSLAQTNLHPQIVSHYLKHSLCKSAFSTHMSSTYPWFSNTSVRYAIQINQIPFIRQEFDKLYASVELSVDRREATT